MRNLGFNSGIAVREGEKYDFSCWARRADTAGLALRVRLESDSGEALSDTLNFGVHAGGWQNKDSIIGHNYRGRGTVLSQSEFSFVEGQPRHFKLAVDGRKISAWVDGKLLHDAEDRPLVIEPLYASASLDKKRRAVIVKAVNVLGEPQEAEFDLSAWEPGGQGRTFIITGDPGLENSFEDPEKISPAESAVQIEEGLLSAALPGHSLTIFIIPIKE